MSTTCDEESPIGAECDGRDVKRVRVCGESRSIGLYVPYFHPVSLVRYAGEVHAVRAKYCTECTLETALLSSRGHVPHLDTSFTRSRDMFAIGANCGMSSR